MRLGGRPAILPFLQLNTRVLTILARVTSHKQTTDWTDYTTGYAYNLGGALIEEKYTSGRVVKNVLDSNGDLARVESKKTSSEGYWRYADSFTYNPAGAVTSMQLDNGHWESTTFNSRLQPTQIALGTTPTATNLLKLEYGYGTTTNNGNVATQKITVPTSGSPLVFDQTYTYDSLNRLQVAEEKTGTTTNWKQTFTFDRYGNRNFDHANTSQPSSFAYPNVSDPTVNAANNRFSSGQGYTYDASGNVTVDAEGRSFVYDAENKQKEAKNSSNVTIGTYYFDGDGKRVKKETSSETTVFVYDAGGKMVAEYSTNVLPSVDAKVQYQTSDNLGTPRINTDANGGVISRTDYMPFGEEIIALGGRTSTDGYVADDVRQGFTGYINDEETGLDFAKARMYSKSLGRFSGTDPMAIKGAFLINPQNLNRYAYTRNSPLVYVDSNGQCAVPAGLQKGQVGICIEAFIAAPKVNGIGDGDGRTFSGNDPSLTARMRSSFIVSPNENVITETEHLIAKSSVSLPVGFGANLPLAPDAQGAGNIDISGSTTATSKSDSLGESTVVVNLKNGANGFQTTGQDLKNNSRSEIGSAIGAVMVAGSPKGTIDGSATITITGARSSPVVNGTLAAGRPYPSYAGYAYYYGSDGKLVTKELFRKPETKPERLIEPVENIPTTNKVNP